MTLNLSLPEQFDELKPRITVIGVGGAGGNAINNMIRSHLTGVEFMAANTDSQALRASQADHKVQLGLNITHGLGAGSRPDVGRAAAEEAQDEILAALDACHMIFITAGMGGGTGTGAAPVIARMAREGGILTVGVVTKPFHFEGAHRMRTAEAGIAELASYVDTLIVIPNQNLFRIASEKTTFAEAFQIADDVLHSGVRGVTDLMVREGLINLDFADIRAVMREMGKAMMGTGEASGEKRAIESAEAAISNPLLDDASMKGARGILINITGGIDMTLFEVDQATNRIRDEVDPEANIIFGATFDDTLDGSMRVSVVATGIDGTGRAVCQDSQPVSEAIAGQDKIPSPGVEADAPVVDRPASTSAVMPTEPKEAGFANITTSVGIDDEKAVARPTRESEPLGVTPVPLTDPGRPARHKESRPQRGGIWSILKPNRTARTARVDAFIPPPPAVVTNNLNEAALAKPIAPVQASVTEEPRASDITKSATLFRREASMPVERLAICDNPTEHALVPPASGPTSNSHESTEDVLEIPAFLRRQAKCATIGNKE